jgi:hypothetical protein
MSDELFCTQQNIALRRISLEARALFRRTSMTVVLLGPPYLIITRHKRGPQHQTLTRRARQIYNNEVPCRQR